MKIEIENIGYWSALDGQFRRSQTSHSYFKFILDSFLPNISPFSKKKSLKSSILAKHKKNFQ